jgi:AraC family transcriptional regulator
MLKEVSEIRSAEEDGGPPTMFGVGSAPGESGVYVFGARFQGGMHVSATARRHHIYFQVSERRSAQPRFECRIADRLLSHKPPAGSLAICPAGSDYAADADRSLVSILVAIDPGSRSPPPRIRRLTPG